LRDDSFVVTEHKALAITGSEARYIYCLV